MSKESPTNKETEQTETKTLGELFTDEQIVKILKILGQKNKPPADRRVELLKYFNTMKDHMDKVGLNPEYAAWMVSYTIMGEV